MAPNPVRITKSDPRAIVIEWDDGRRSVLSARALRSACPCAGCIDELTGIRRHDPASVSPDLVQDDVRLVGNYAIAIQFSDGHATGIYPFAMLRDLPPEE
jgi:DUF971 family protein